LAERAGYHGRAEAAIPVSFDTRAGGDDFSSRAGISLPPSCFRDHAREPWTIVKAVGTLGEQDLTMYPWIAVALASGALCLAACGGLVDSSFSDADASDSAAHFLACGGDVLGTWIVSSASLVRAPTPSPSACQGRATISTTPVASGSVTFRSDGTMTSDTSIGNDQTSVIPLSCTQAHDCASLQSSMQSGSLSVSCASSGSSACVCSTTLMPRPAPLDMLYQVEGGNIVIHLNGTWAPIPYCVENNTLSWLFTAPAIWNGEVVRLSASR
jgi:hypothetical protein